MRTFRQLLVVCAGVGWTSLFPDATRAQAPQNRYWATVGLGPASSGLAGGASGSFYKAPHLLSIRALSTAAFDMLGCERDDVTDIGLLYGRGSRRPRSWRSIAAGVGLVFRSQQVIGGGFDCVEETTDPTIGVPIEAQLVWTPASGFGLGVSAFANLNATKSFVGAQLAISFGRFGGLD